MTDGFSFKDLAMVTTVPERMNIYNYVRLDEIVDQIVEIKDFELFESQNTEKYSDETKTGVHVVLLKEDGTYCRITTHSRGIVRAFKAINDKKIPIPVGVKTTITSYRTTKGMTAYTFGN